MGKIAKKDHLQCGCKKVEQPNQKFHKSDTNTKGVKCKCTIQKPKATKLKNIEFGSMFLGTDGSIR